METSLQQFEYLADRVKLQQYQAAMEKLVRPEHTVLDLGCGSGVIGLMALRAGARKVYFVDHGPVIEVARQIVAEAGFSDRAEFFQASSFELALPEQVDVVVCDHVGFFGFDYGVLELLADARQRFLKPGGITVPAQIELQLAPVESVTCRKFVGQWQDGSVPEEFGWLSTTAANTMHATELTEKDLLADAVTIATLDLGAEIAPYLSWDAEFSCARDGTLDGVAGWFDCKLYDDVHMTNSPAAAEFITRSQAFLPLASPVPISAGDDLRVTVMARPQDNVIGWLVELPGSGKRFAHNTFNGLELDREALMRAQPGRVAKLNDRGLARQVVLSYCDGHRTVAEVQELVQREHPNLFPSAHARSSFVTQVLSWDTSE
jgi:ubiquinone/menaquinone biosynthesis C-methylase UbiE